MRTPVATVVLACGPPGQWVGSSGGARWMVMWSKVSGDAEQGRVTLRPDYLWPPPGRRNYYWDGSYCTYVCGYIRCEGMLWAPRDGGCSATWQHHTDASGKWLEREARNDHRQGGHSKLNAFRAQKIPFVMMTSHIGRICEMPSRERGTLATWLAPRIQLGPCAPQLTCQCQDRMPAGETCGGK